MSLRAAPALPQAGADDMPPDMTVDVWWARAEQAQPWHAEVLSAAERERLGRWRRPADQVRSGLGAALLRMVVAGRLRLAPADVVVRRECLFCGEAHGRPTLPGTDLTASITHSGDWVGVALAHGAEVGLDVERVVDLDADALADQLLADEEHADVDGALDVLQRWVRKEAVLKATGEGLSVDPRHVVLAGTDDGARLVSHAGRPGLEAGIVDISPGYPYVAAVALLSPEPFTVVRRAVDVVLSGMLVSDAPGRRRRPPRS